MARKKVVDLSADTTVRFDKPGQTFEGYYIGSKKVSTSMGPSVLHIFETEEGNVGVWGSAQLNAKLQQCLGMKTFIKYLSKVKVPKGTMKTFEVEYDDADTTAVADPQVNFRETNEPESDDVGYAQDDEVLEDEIIEEDEVLEDEIIEEDEEAEEEVAPPKALAPSRPSNTPPAGGQRRPPSGASNEQKAKVEQILNNRKR